MGVEGDSTNGTGVSGWSSTGNAIYGGTTSGTGVYGYSREWTGIEGSSTNSIGVYGYSTNSIGGAFFIDPSSTNTLAEVLRVQRRTSGTAAAGIGGYISFPLEDSAGNTYEDAARIGVLYTNATHGAEESDLVFYNRAAGASAAEVMRIKAGGNVGIGTTAPTAKLSIAATSGIETLRPNATGTNTDVLYQQSNSTAHWDKVSEASPDDWTTYVYETRAAYHVDTYNIPDHSSGSGPISNVKVYFRSASTNVSLKAKAAVYTHSALYYGDEQSLNIGSFTTYSYQWNTNPNTGNAWTWAEIDALEIGVALQGQGAPDWGMAMGTQVYVEVNYNTSDALIVSTGNVGIGTTDPAGYKLNIAGTGYLGAAEWVYGSDQRLKQNIAYLGSSSGLEQIMALKPARFDYISGEKNQLGFIAQDVQSVIPEAVVTVDPQTGMLGLKNNFIIPYLVKGMQEQQNQIANLQLVLGIDGTISATSTDATSTDMLTQNDSGIVSWIKNGLAKLGLAIQDGVASMKEVIASRFTGNRADIENIQTKQICVVGDDNRSVCLNRDQLEDLINRAGSSYTVNQTFTSSDNTTATTTPNTVHSQ